MTKTKPKNGQNRHVGFTLFLVSKQVHDESKAIFFKEAMFDLRQHTAILTPSFEPFYSVRNLIESKPSNLLRMEEVIVSDPWTAMHFGKVRKEMSVDEKAGPVSPLRYMTIDYQWKLESAWLIFEDEKPAHSPSAWQKMLLREVLTTVVANSGHTQVQYTLQDFPFEFDLPFDDFMLSEDRDVVTLTESNPANLGLNHTLEEELIVDTLGLRKKVKFVWKG